MSDEQQAQPGPDDWLIPTAPAVEIPEPIRNGVETFYVLVISDDSGSRRPGGNPIVWEHPLPTTTRLREVLRKQAEVGNRYGASFIAECRILPDLTIDPGSERPEQRGLG